MARHVLVVPLAMPGPHDLFARYTFGHPERAAAELRAALPSHVVSEVDWSSLRREPGSVVDPELRETESDLLFTAHLRSGQPLLLYVLLEHQSSVDRWMALRMLRPGPPLARLAWLVLRYGRTDELAQRLPDWAALFAQVQAAPDGSEHLVVVIRYLLWVGDKAAHEAARQVLHSVLDTQRTEALMQSYAEELIERGRQQERLHARAEGVLRILAVRGVQVADEARQRILTSTDLATLDLWFDRALNATTLSDVLEDSAS